MNLLFWKYCELCKLPIGIDFYPFNTSPNYQDDINRELKTRMLEHKKCCKGESNRENVTKKI